MLPKTSTFIPLFFQEFHSSDIGGHLGVLKTYKRMATELYWEGMKKDVQRFVEACDVY